MPIDEDDREVEEPEPMPQIMRDLVDAMQRIEDSKYTLAVDPRAYPKMKRAVEEHPDLASKLRVVSSMLVSDVQTGYLCPPRAEVVPVIPYGTSNELDELGQFPGLPWERFAEADRHRQDLLRDMRYAELVHDRPKPEDIVGITGL